MARQWLARLLFWIWATFALGALFIVTFLLELFQVTTVVPQLCSGSVKEQLQLAEDARQLVEEQRQRADRSEAMRQVVLRQLLEEQQKVTMLQREVASLQSEMATLRLNALFQELDRVVCENGGLKEGHTGDRWVQAQTDTYDTWAKTSSALNMKTVCETGFNAGHSALRFIAQSNVTYYAFDLGAHKYSRPAVKTINRMFPGTIPRLNVTWGRSEQTLPKFHRENPHVKCDLLIADGGHFQGVALSDLMNFRKMAAEKHILTIDDTPCDPEHCQEVKRAWNQMKARGCIVEEKAIQMQSNRGFSIGRYNFAKC